VTGSNPGTPTKPCFPLKALWEHCLIPSVEKLVATGGPCAGALVILQEDNAGPHTEGNNHKWSLIAFAMKESFFVTGSRLECRISRKGIVNLAQRLQPIRKPCPPSSGSLVKRYPTVQCMHHHFASMAFVVGTVRRFNQA
jgi:hypothetical protein